MQLYTLGLFQASDVWRHCISCKFKFNEQTHYFVRYVAYSKRQCYVERTAWQNIWAASCLSLKNNKNMCKDVRYTYRLLKWYLHFCGNERFSKLLISINNTGGLKWDLGIHFITLRTYNWSETIDSLPKFRNKNPNQLEGLKWLQKTSSFKSVASLP